jgi:hypothetical protein
MYIAAIVAGSIVTAVAINVLKSATDSPVSGAGK